MLVTLEGLDGSGKTTVWEALTPEYPDAEFTREPTDDLWTGELVRESIQDERADSVTELFLFVADHAEHLSQVVEPALAEDRLVISDRYSDSRYAYQGATLQGRIDRPMEYVRGIHQPFTRRPDLTVYLDVDPQTAADRSAAANKFEREEFLSQVRENYERLIEYQPERWVRVDATRSPEEVIDRAQRAIDAVREQRS